jgi:glyoxylase I family protein
MTDPHPKPSVPLISGDLAHITLCVAEVEAARTFYVDLLGFDVLPRPDLPMPGLWLQRGDLQLHLMAPPDPAELPRARAMDATPIGPHIAFRVSELSPVLAQLRAAGVPVVASEYIANQAFAADPSGNLIEFIVD